MYTGAVGVRWQCHLGSSALGDKQPDCVHGDRASLSGAGCGGGVLSTCGEGMRREFSYSGVKAQTLKLAKLNYVLSWASELCSALLGLISYAILNKRYEAINELSLDVAEVPKWKRDQWGQNGCD